jgi:O-antigen/teichoic acid export membrane protein
VEPWARSCCWRISARRDDDGTTPTDGAATAATLGLAALAGWLGPVGWWLAAAALAETLRRALVAQRRMLVVLAVDTVLLILTWSALYLWAPHHQPYVSCAVIAGGALLAAGGHALALRSSARPRWAEVPALLRSGVPTLPLRLAETGLIPALLATAGALAGTTAAAQFQVVMTVLGLVNPMVFALGTVLVVELRAGRDGGRILRLASMLTLPPFLALVCWPDIVLKLLFPAAYAGLSETIRLLALVVPATVYVHFAVCRLLADERHRQLLVLQLSGWLAATFAVLACWLNDHPAWAAPSGLAAATAIRLSVALAVRAKAAAVPPR